MTVRIIKNQGFKIMVLRASLPLNIRIRGSDIIRSAFAGVGKPIKDVVWFSSILNRANL